MWSLGRSFQSQTDDSSLVVLDWFLDWHTHVHTCMHTHADTHTQMSYIARSDYNLNGARHFDFTPTFRLCQPHKGAAEIQLVLIVPSPAP